MAWLSVGQGLLRFALAIIVLLEHTTNIRFGGLAVYTFFVLSGYWISRAWNEGYSMGRAPYLVFTVSRLWRLYPAFLIAMAFSLWLSKATVSWEGFSLLGAARMEREIPPVWTLDIEIQFYLVAPLLLGLLAQRRGAVYLLVVSLAFALLQELQDATRGLMTYLLFFAIGAAAAELKWKPSTAVGLTSLVATALIPAIFYFAPNLKHVFFEPIAADTIFWSQAALAIVAAPFAIWVMRFKAGKLDAFFGRMSYTLYLIHWPIIEHAGRYYTFIPDLGPLQPRQTASVIAAVGLYLLETPFEMARARFVRWTRRPSRDALPATAVASPA